MRARSERLFAAQGDDAPGAIVLMNGGSGLADSTFRYVTGVTRGGYSESIVVDERFVLSLPNGDNLAGVAPLLCAGITTYSPLRHWKVGPGQKVGIVGLGGLGHMGVKFAAAFGAHTVLLTTSPGKAEDAKRLGAKEVIVSRDEEQMAEHMGSFDFILNTVSAAIDLSPYLGLLKVDGTMVLLGAPENPTQMHAFGLIFGRKSLGGSLIGGIKETQEMLDFCAENDIVSDVEVIPMDQINDAYERVGPTGAAYWARVNALIGLLEGGAPGIHFYTLNKSHATRSILAAVRA